MNVFGQIQKINYVYLGNPAWTFIFTSQVLPSSVNDDTDLASLKAEQEIALPQVGSHVIKLIIMLSLPLSWDYDTWICYIWSNEDLLIVFLRPFWSTSNIAVEDFGVAIWMDFGGSVRLQPPREWTIHAKWPECRFANNHSLRAATFFFA